MIHSLFLIPIISLFWAYFANRQKKDYTPGLVAVGVIGLIALLIPTIAATFRVYNAQVNMRTIQRNIVAKQAEYKKVENCADASIAKYPLEKGLFGSLSRTLLLKMPEIRGDSLLVAKLKQMAELEDEIYKLNVELNENKGCLDWHSAWFSMSLISPYPEKD
ncbi:hypothetical protein HOA55_04590 [archaeon]|jgi:hypothetical protein|nr:hypothetical protein [archaeon]MBT6820607.1 hypothetical protein [archaeon]MBT7024983.1 hypothetical protein [archaeon]MBT7238602.1 hypothetical protein [archaeon]MBT7914258.1 hypothetical protein [Candidatus Bathyarchaeota archaeon]